MPALPIYLAAFDGHQEIFLIGYSKQMEFDNSRWMDDVRAVFDAYTEVKFWLIGESTTMPDLWLDCPNIKTMNYQDFVSYADV